ncbi:PREDICTED: translation initiation factor IF-2-like [Chinchilla lanigera]|uniref:translation initiation factor IF-2-like n=1 Tax=Chinchilla lanigera TaxID=34839 RepID=UPI000696A7D9|nr:PREDICTED: translation initiation factor IF-2-like [Chinchilla lanigera]
MLPEQVPLRGAKTRSSASCRARSAPGPRARGSASENFMPDHKSSPRTPLPSSRLSISALDSRGRPGTAGPAQAGARRVPDARAPARAPGSGRPGSGAPVSPRAGTRPRARGGPVGGGASRASSFCATRRLREGEPRFLFLLARRFLL